MSSSVVSAHPKPLPTSLQYYVAKLQNFRRIQSRFLMSGSSTANSGSTVRLTFPRSMSLLDLSTARIDCDLTITTSTTTIVPANIHSSLIKSVQVNISGQTVLNISDYNQYAMILNNWFRGSDARSRLDYNLFTAGSKSISANTTYQISIPLGEILSFKPEIFPIGISGDIEIILNLAGNAVLGNATLGNATWAVANLVAVCDAISFSDGSYEKMLYQSLQSGMVAELVYTNIQGYNSLVASGNQSTRVSVSSGSLDTLIASVVNSTYDTTTTATASSTDLSSYFLKRGDLITDGQFSVNGVPLTSQPVNTSYAVVHNATNSNTLLDLLGGHIISSITNIRDKYALFQRLNIGSASDRVLSGLSTNLSNTVVEFKSTGSAGNMIVYIFCVMSSVLRLGLGQLEVVV